MAEKTVVEQVAQEVLDLLASRGALKEEVVGLEEARSALVKTLEEAQKRLDALVKRIDAAIKTKNEAEAYCRDAIAEKARVKAADRKEIDEDRKVVRELAASEKRKLGIELAELISKVMAESKKLEDVNKLLDKARTKVN